MMTLADFLTVLVRTRPMIAVGVGCRRGREEEWFGGDGWKSTLEVVEDFRNVGDFVCGSERVVGMACVVRWKMRFGCVGLLALNSRLCEEWRVEQLEPAHGLLSNTRIQSNGLYPAYVDVCFVLIDLVVFSTLYTHIFPIICSGSLH